MIANFIHKIFKGRKKTASQETLLISAHKQGLSKSRVSKGALRVIEGLQGAGFVAYIVGGAVRDLWLQKSPKDFDVATNARPEEVRRLFKRSRIIGRRFQIVHVLVGQETIEVTTFRGTPKQGFLNRPNVDEEGRLLRDNSFGTQKEDAARRDFTVNALYYDPIAETLIDDHKGLADLAKRTLRIIGEPEVRYREDPVRMLRALRFAAKLGFELETKTAEPICELAPLIANIPASRLLDEMMKICTSGAAHRSFLRLHEAGIDEAVFPILTLTFNDGKLRPFAALALQKTDLRVQEERPISPSFLFAALLWEAVREKADALQKPQATDEDDLPLKPLQAELAAIEMVLKEHAFSLGLTHRITGGMKEIWAKQPRFLQRSGKRPFALVEQAGFKAAYDFLLLRAETGEVEEALAQWWEAFLHADPNARADMLIAPKLGEKKRRRVRKKPAKQIQENE